MLRQLAKLSRLVNMLGIILLKLGIQEQQEITFLRYAI